ncbi:hypothetical protein [Streptomyces sp. NPDC046261]|uniref:hypothetical protein n=1 Tax=Streptomyces sp. NPDC046261 TaxID=3157200 RepID=UPI0033EE5F13
MPAAACLVAVAMSAATGCVAVSPHDDRHGDRSVPPRLSRAAEPEAGPGPARESLITTGDGPERGRASLGRSTDPPLVLTGDPPWGPSWGPGREPVWRTAEGPGGGPSQDAAWEPSWRPSWGPPANRGQGAAGSARPAGPGERQSAEPPRTARPPAADGRSAEPPASAPVHRQAPGAPAPPAHRHGESHSRSAPQSHGEAPAPAPAAPAPPQGRKGNGVCAMGDTYGKWQKGGDASRICRQVYGN